MTYRNYTSDPVTINGQTIDPYAGRRSLKPTEGVTFVLPTKMWVKVRHREDVVSVYKGELHGISTVSAHRTT